MTDFPAYNNPVAIVVDNVVEKIINFDDEFIALIRSNPLFIDLKGGIDLPELGYVYNPATKTFSAPDPTAPEPLNITVE